MNDGKTFQRRMRIDVVVFPMADPTTGEIANYVCPNPKRYERREMNGILGYYDMFENTFIPDAALQELVGRTDSMPVGTEIADVRDALAYVESRKSRIRALLEGEGNTDRTLVDPSEEFLESLDVKHEIAILSLDVVGSTRLAVKAPEEWQRIVPVVLEEVAETVVRFHGHVLKYTGDGVLAYFAAPSYIIKNDMAVDCAATLLLLVRDGIRPVLKDIGLPDVSVRIGIDSGEATVVTLGSPSTKRQKDIIGSVANLACKIQGKAPEGALAVSHSTLRSLHTDWRCRFIEMTMGKDWDYPDREGDGPCRVFVLEIA